MSQQNFEHQLAKFTNAIKLCLDYGLTLPALTILYAAIDALAWLSKADEKDRVGDSFQDWVKTYMLRSYKGELGPPEQVALDLYGARSCMPRKQNQI